MERDTLFTPEAERILAEESSRLVEEFRQQAMDEALRARGTPVEVTASDVRRARLRFVKREGPLRPLTEMTLRVYAVLGALLVIGGTLYPVIKPLIEKGDPTFKTSLLLAGMGVVLLVTSVLGRYYLRIRNEILSRRLLERYEREREEEGPSRRREG